MKKLIVFISACLLAISPMGVSAQVDAVDSDKRVMSTQVPLEQCDWLDTCEVARYGIVCKDKKYGIYDLQEHKNLTEIDLGTLCYSRHLLTEDSIDVCYFYAEKGLQCGNIGVTNGETVAVWMDNPDLICSLDECSTIDEAITGKCRKELKKAMERLKGNYGQVAVIDSQTGQLKAWVALESDKNGKISDGKLIKYSCTSSLMKPMLVAALFGKSDLSMEDSVDTRMGMLNLGDTLVVRDHNWRMGGYGKVTYRQGFARKSDVAMFKALCYTDKRDGIRKWQDINSNVLVSNAMDMAALIGSFYNDDKLVIPSLIGDSVRIVDELPFTTKMKSNLRSVLVDTNKDDGVQAKYAPKDIAVAGLYGSIKNPENQRELSYAGCFPADSPRYAIGFFVDKDDEDYTTHRQLSAYVNEMIEWLSKR